MFANGDDAKQLRWHVEGRKNDGLLRHPADSPQWKEFDRLYPDFGNEPRNIRVVVASDGMNPFGNLSMNHSSCLVYTVFLPCFSWTKEVSFSHTGHA